MCWHHWTPQRTEEATRQGLKAHAEAEAVSIEQMTMVYLSHVGTGLWHKGGRLHQASARWSCSLGSVAGCIMAACQVARCISAVDTGGGIYGDSNPMDSMNKTHAETTQSCWEPNVIEPANPGFLPLQIRNALALALILNRTLVFPEMLCYCDRYW